MSPHFRDNTLTIIQIFLMFLISLPLIYSHFTKQNLAALYIGLGTFFAALGYLMALLPLLDSPVNLFNVAWYSNVVAASLWYTCYSLFVGVIIFTQFPRLPIWISLVVLFLGLLVVGTSVYTFQPYTINSAGIYEFYRNPIDDMLQFICGIMIAFGLGKFFYTSFRGQTYKLYAMLNALGISLAAISLPLIPAIQSNQLALIVQQISICGLLLILAGTYGSRLAHLKRP
jgi:hypothetical protein